MPGGRWDFYQNINAVTKQVEWPMGELDPQGETLLQLEAWVMQSSTGATQKTVQTEFLVPKRWTADGIPPGTVQGAFQNGPATGIALLSSRKANGANNFTWWVSVLELRV
jgi:hypothetical protein